MKSVENNNPSIEDQVNMNNEIKEEVRNVDGALETEMFDNFEKNICLFLNMRPIFA